MPFNEAEKVKVAQSFLTLCDPVDCGPLGASVLGILQARILERVAFPSPEDLPSPGMEPTSYWQPGSLPLVPPGKPKEMMGVVKKS